MQKRRFIWIMLLFLVAVAAVALLNAHRAQQGSSVDAPLALVNDVPITEDDFAFEVRRRMAAGRPMQGGPDAVLEDLIERELMLQQARTSDALQDPDVQREVENRVLSSWLENTLHTKKDQVRVTDAELQSAYQDRLAAFTRPALTRLAILYRKRPAAQTAEALQTLVAELEQAMAAFRENPSQATGNGRLPGFGRIASEYSEHTVSRYRGGDLGWFDPERGLVGIPGSVLSVGEQLAIGEMSDVLVTDDGLYVVMKTGAREPQTTPFKEAAIVLRRRLIREKQDQVEEMFLRSLREGASISKNAAKATALSGAFREQATNGPAPPDMRVP